MKTLSVRRRQALTLPELFILLGCLTICVLIALPKLSRSHRPAPRINCTNNLKQVGLAFRTWALDHNDKYPMSTSVTNGGTMEVVQRGVAYTHFEVMSNELSTPRVLHCPDDNTRKPGTSFGGGFNEKNLSYFVGVDATDTNWNMFLAGDDSLLVQGKTPKSGLLCLTTNTAISWSKSRHPGQGNIGLADGSVQQFDSTRLARALAETGSITNRILMP